MLEKNNISTMVVAFLSVSKADFYIGIQVQILVFLVRLSGVVHTGVEVRRMYSEMSRLVE